MFDKLEITKNYIRNLLKGKKFGTEEPLRYRLEELSDIVKKSYEDSENGADIASSRTCKYFFSNGQSEDAIRNLYDAAQFITHKESALKDISYSLKPNKYVLFLEDNLFNISHYGEWREYVNIEFSKKSVDTVLNGLNRHLDRAKVVQDLDHIFVMATFAMATNNNLIGMKEFTDYVNITFGKDNTRFAFLSERCLLDKSYLAHVAIKADYNFMNFLSPVGLPPGKTGRFVKSFIEKYGESLFYENN